LFTSCIHISFRAPNKFSFCRGCKFVGHGLRQDFLTVNLFVPPCQIIDTVDIYRMENRRYISLRFLVNYLLGRDMQIEIHDSIEDSKAANELYLKALELKEKGNFEETLRHIYERGQQIDWKVAEINLK
jgi:PAB-dependent poly(A)-specific ribonuclease subunit 2